MSDTEKMLSDAERIVELETKFKAADERGDQFDKEARGLRFYMFEIEEIAAKGLTKHDFERIYNIARTARLGAAAKAGERLG